MELRVNGKTYQSIFDAELWPKPIIGDRDDGNGGRCVLGQLEYAVERKWITESDEIAIIQRLGKAVQDTVEPVNDPLNCNVFSKQTWIQPHRCASVLAAVNNQLPEFQKQSKWVEIDLATRQA